MFDARKTRKREFVRKLLDKSKKEKEKEKEKTRAIEIIDLTRPDPTFSQKGIFADSVREAFGLRGGRSRKVLLKKNFIVLIQRILRPVIFWRGGKECGTGWWGVSKAPNQRKNYFVLTF